MIVLGVPTYRRYDLLSSLVESAMGGTLVPDKVIVVDNGGRFDERYRGPLDRLEVIRPGRNLGCAGGWNLIFKQAESPGDILVVANDDLVLTEDGVSNLVSAVDTGGGNVVASDHGLGGHRWSVFAMPSSLWRRIGMFDERFWPAYFEDNDYEFRLSIAGIRLVSARAAKSHVSGGTRDTYSADELRQHEQRLRANGDYYRTKWGGRPGKETRRVPAIVRGHAASLEDRFAALCREPSDINEHLPTIRAYASRVEHVTEFGVRSGRSTTALLAAQPRVLRSYDISPCPIASDLGQLAFRTAFAFSVADTLAIDSEPTDLLFVDTLHTYEQLKRELQLHARAVRRWIVLHDTTTFGERGETKGSRGLWPAVEEFVAHGEWKVAVRHINNNGLTVIERATVGVGTENL